MSDCRASPVVDALIHHGGETLVLAQGNQGSERLSACPRSHSEHQTEFESSRAA